MSAEVDIANIPADQGRSLFGNSGCRSSGAVVQGDGRNSAVSFNESQSILPSDQTEWQKSPAVPETSTQACSKRHYSFSVVERQFNSRQRRSSDKCPAGAVAFSSRRRGGRMGRYHALRERIVLPTRFLLGGNITDPLNLNSLCDDEVNRSMNQTTPISSPVPIPMHRLEVQVLVPVNSADPLNLNAEDGDNSTEMKAPSLPRSVFRKRRKRNRRRKRNVAEGQGQLGEQVSLDKSSETEVRSIEEMQLDRPADDTGAECLSRHKRVIDHIVSPVIPQRTSKWKRRRTASESRTETVAEDHLGETLGGIKVEKTLTRHKRRHLSMHVVDPHVPLHFRAKDRKFSRGNYSGNGTVLGHYEDHRLAYFSKEMFSGKDVLDVGCGVGHVSLCIARDFGARRVVGLDIDRKAVDTAVKNKQHFASAMLPDIGRFPVAVRGRLGPLVAPQLLMSSESDILHHVTFLMGDYVPRSDEELQQQREEYDVILGLRITKWIHLNYGDVGLKQTFRRMYKQLRPGGLLVLEMQPWKSYRKKKKLTEHIFQTYRSIAFRPDMFADYLMSREVGFASCERLRPRSRQCIGLKQPLYVFKKLLRECTLALSTTSQSLVSARSLVVCSVHGTPECRSSCCWQTPRFEVGSTSRSTTPCSTTPNAGDVTSPYSSSSSSSSTSSPLSSCHHISPTHVTAVSVDASAAVSSVCSVSNEPQTSASETARHSGELLQSMHHTAQCSCTVVRRHRSDTELLYSHSPSHKPRL